MSMKSYWLEKDYGLKPGEIAPWKLQRDKHATISVITHGQKDFDVVDKYLFNSEQQFKVKYLKRLNGSTKQAWEVTKHKLNAQFNKRKRSVALCACNLAAIKNFGLISRMK